MKRIMVTLVALLFISVGQLSSNAAEQKQQLTEPMKMQEKEQYEKSMKERLGKLGQQLDELKAKAATKSDQAGEKMKDYLAEAEKKQKAAALKLEEMRKDSKDKWEKFSAEMDKAAKDFEQAYERAKSRLKE